MLESVTRRETPIGRKTWRRASSCISLEKRVLRVASPERGRFRSFLQSSLRHYLANERKRARTKKRGGGKPPIPMDFEDAESRLRHEPAHQETPERLFEKRWSRTLLTRTLEALHEEQHEPDEKNRLHRLEPCGGRRDTLPSRRLSWLIGTAGKRRHKIVPSARDGLA